MDRSAIEKIQESAIPNISSHHGFEYTDKKLNVINLPLADAMKFHTLKGLCEVVEKEVNLHCLPMIISVKEYNCVYAYSSIRKEDRSRELLYYAESETSEIPFGRPCSHEQMMISLKSNFVQTDELNELVKLLGTITEENNKTTSDDGFSQSVVVKVGIVTKENKVIKPTVNLIPYRTFLEVSQPESSFLLRLSDGGYVTLHEADGGEWKLRAREYIAEYLKKELSAFVEDGNILIVE